MATTIRTLGQAARHKLIVRTTCRKCGRSASFLASDLALFYGAGRPIRSLPFRCTQCGNTKPEIDAVMPDGERGKGRVVWRPMRL